MSRTSIFRRIERALKRAAAANRMGLPFGSTGTEIDAVVSQRRRRFLRDAGILAGSAMLGPGLVACSAGRPKPSAVATTSGASPSIAVVGGGMAGLLCTYRLQQAGLDVELYEATNRFGGRMFSNRRAFAPLVCEMGGELINSDHLTMRGLAEEFGIALDDLYLSDPGVITETFHIDGRVLQEDEIVDAFRPLAARMAAAHAEAESSDAAYLRYDRMSVAEFLDASDVDPDLRRLLEMGYVSEMGLELDRQCVFLLLDLIDWAAPDPFRLLGDSDERYHVRGGNDLLTSALVDRIEERRLHPASPLVRIADRSAGGYELVFADESGGARPVRADFVVLAIPFSTLRLVDTAGLALPEVKRRLIREFAYGTNAKLMTGYSSRPWRTAHGRNGTTVTDIENGTVQVLWDTARGQVDPLDAAAAGIVTNFAGGAAGVALGNGATDAQAARIVKQMDRIYAGSADAYAGKAVRMHWPSAPYALGSYACFEPGFYSLYEAVGEPVGQLLFCGEHCSHDHQGYMEGAAETGAATAALLIATIGVRAAA